MTCTVSEINLIAKNVSFLPERPSDFMINVSSTIHIIDSQSRKIFIPKHKFYIYSVIILGGQRN